MMRRILFIVPYIPNPIRTRPYNLIRVLAGLGHDVTVLTLVGNDADKEDADALRGFETRVIALPISRGRSFSNSMTALVTDEPLQSVYCWQPALGARLRQLLAEERFDVIHVEHLRGARYGLLAKSLLDAAGLATPVVWDSVDSISHLFRQASIYSPSRLGRWITRLELPRTERFESRVISEFDMVLATSPVDRDSLLELAAAGRYANSSVQVLPNGVDMNKFHPDPLVERDPETLILSGKMSYHANVAMAIFLVREVMPPIWIRRPNTRVMIAGKDPSSEVRSLSADSRVIVTGEVAEMRPYLNRATIAVAPIVYSAGIQNKILEAMACAAPVVATPLALGGLMVEPDKHLLIGDGADALAAGILRLLDDPAQRHAIASSGHRFVMKNHNWQSIGNMLSALYETLLPENLDGGHHIWNPRSDGQVDLLIQQTKSKGS